MDTEVRKKMVRHLRKLVRGIDDQIFVRWCNGMIAIGYYYPGGALGDETKSAIKVLAKAVAGNKYVPVYRDDLRSLLVAYEDKMTVVKTSFTECLFGLRLAVRNKKITNCSALPDVEYVLTKVEGENWFHITGKDFCLIICPENNWYECDNPNAAYEWSKKVGLKAHAQRMEERNQLMMLDIDKSKKATNTNVIPTWKLPS